MGACNFDISIVIPVYNQMADGGHMLRQCVGSVAVPQSFRQQIILVDDGSTDSSGAECDRMAAEFATVCSITVIHRANGGLAAARNTGVEAAGGRYVFFLDADDMVLPCSLNRLLEVADSFAGQRPLIVCGGWTQTAPAPTDATQACTGALTAVAYDPKRFLRDTLFQTGGHPSACGILVELRLARTVRFTEGIWYEDLDWLPRLYLAAATVIKVAQPCYYYRQHKDSFLHRWSHGRLDVLAVTARLENVIANEAPELLPAAHDRRLSANFNIMGLALLAGETKVADDCWQIVRQYRAASLFGRHTRLKNRIGAALSYLGRPIMSQFLKFVYR